MVEDRTDRDTKRSFGYSFACFLQDHPILKKKTWTGGKRKKYTGVHIGA
jgi:hypothetical protein